MTTTKHRLERNELLTIDDLNRALSYDHLSGILKWKVRLSKRIVVGKIAGSKRKSGYSFVRINKKVYPAHRISWFLHYGKWPELCIDHINGIRDDNRIENLRDVSRRVNGQNLKIHRSGRLFGCTYEKITKKWRAQITLNGKLFHIGCFLTEIDAHNAYLKRLNKFEEFLQK